MTWLDIDLKTWIDIGLKVIAGLWAFGLLFYLRRRTNALVNIEKAQADTAKARTDALVQRARLQMDIEGERRKILSSQLADREIELRIKRQVSVSVAIELDESKLRVDFPLVANVRLTNSGNEATRIKWQGEAPAFTVRPVSFDNDGKPVYREGMEFHVGLTRAPNLPAVSHVIRAGCSEILAFAFQPKAPGLYLLSFRAATDGNMREDAKKHGVEMPTSWTAKRYVYVPETLPAVVADYRHDGQA